MPVAPAEPRQIVEHDESRTEGRPKVSGRAMYSADAHLPGMLHAAFATSTYSHAVIKRIDVSTALAAPGVRAVLTGADIGDRYLGRCLLDWPVLALERVRFIGEYVAAVAADTSAQAQAAANLIEVEYEELPAIFDASAALTAGAPILHEAAERYAFLGGSRRPVSHPNIQGEERVGQGDIETAFRDAARVFEHEFTTPRMHPGYIEPRATIVWLDDAESVHVMTTNKSPYSLRQQMSAGLGIPEERISIDPVFIGGDFGGKGLSIDEFVCYYLARATRRPVKAVRSYLDDIQSTNVRHAATITVKSAISAEHQWTGLKITVVFNGGAYAAGKPIPHLLPGLGPKTAYHIPNTRIERACVYTNTVPGGHVRAPSDIQIFFALESHVDLIANELGEDPLSFRLRHAIRGSQTDIDGVAYHQPRAVETLEAVRDADAWRRPLKPGQGRGLAISARHIGGGKTSAIFALHADGTVHVKAGMVEQGAGALTMLQRVLGQELGLPVDDIFIHRASTSDAPIEGGAGASKVTHILGRAAQCAAAEIISAMRAAIAKTTGSADESVILAAGAFRSGSQSFSWQDAAAITCANEPLERIVTYDSAITHPHGRPESANFCAFVVTVTVDRETGAFHVDDVLCVVDVGAIINPLAHRGQIDGGFVWGFGSALMEDLVVEDGKIVNLSLADYKLPTIRDVPPFRVLELCYADGPGPYGAKAVGEVSTAAVPPAIANAIAAACGARIVDLPLTAERVFNSLHPEQSSATTHGAARSSRPPR